MTQINAPHLRSQHRHAGGQDHANRPDSSRRRRLQQFCAECHVVVPNGKAGWTDAPAFDAIANKPGTTAKFLRTFIQQPHMHMVNTGRPPGQAADIAAYILTLRTR